MIEAIGKGVLAGLSMLLFIGPVFFTLLKSALQHGIKTGVSVAFGIFISDVICVLICYSSLSLLVNNPINNSILSIAGSIILFLLGFKYVIRSNKLTSQKIMVTKSSLGKNFFKGFLVNFVNPFVFAVWIGLISFAENEFNQEVYIILFLTTTLITILITDVIKAYLSQYLKSLLNPKYLNLTYKVIGVIFILFAVRLFLNESYFQP